LDAGINDQKDGLFGAISFVPEPGSGLLLVLGISGLGLFQGLRRQFRKRFAA
jgi:hypothetical protein